MQRLHACADAITLRQRLLYQPPFESPSHFDHIQFEIPLLKRNYGGGCQLMRQVVSEFGTYDQEISSDQT